MRPLHLVVLCSLFACSDPQAPPPTETETPSPSDTGTPTDTDSPTDTGTPGHTGTPTEVFCELISPTTPIGPTADCPVYRIDRNLRWEPSLELLPGTVLEIAAGVDLRVKGELLAEGTAGDPIVLRSQGDGAWGGLELSGKGSSGYGNSYDDVQLRHVQIREAGDGVPAALVLSGTYYRLDYYGDGVGRSALFAEGLSLHDLVSGGIVVEDNYLYAIDPIGFENVAGPLISVDRSMLGDDLVADLGGNLAPWVEVRSTWSSPVHDPGTWSTQSVPLHVLDLMAFEAEEAFDCYDARSPTLTIEPNTLLLDEDAAFRLHGAAMIATGTTFSPLQPGGSWGGIRSEGLHVIYDCGGELNPFPAQLTLTGVTLTGAASPAIEWLGRNPAEDVPALSSTTITGTVAPPGTDVCVSIDRACPDLATGNALDCSVPVDCR